MKIMDVMEITEILRELSDSGEMGVISSQFSSNLCDRYVWTQYWQTLDDSSKETIFRKVADLFQETGAIAYRNLLLLIVVEESWQCRLLSRYLANFTDDDCRELICDVISKLKQVGEQQKTLDEFMQDLRRAANRIRYYKRSGKIKIRNYCIEKVNERMARILSWDLNSEDEMLYDGIYRRLEKVLNNKELELLKARYIDEISCAKYAQEKGLNPSSVRKTLTRAISNSTRHLEAWYPDFPRIVGKRSHQTPRDKINCK